MIVRFFKVSALITVLLGCCFTPAQAECPDQSPLYARGQELYQHGQYLLSSLHFSEVSVTPCNPRLAARATYAFSLGMMALGENVEALRSLSKIEASSDSETRDRAHLLHAYLVPEFDRDLSPSSRLRLDLWKSKYDPARFAKLTDSAELLEIEERLQLLPQKSVFAAGAASAILPGAGQAYVGVYQSAAISLVLNALFLATTLEFAKNKMPAAAVASGFVLSITYLGNILNAVDSAQQRNSNARAPLEEKLKNALFPEFTP